MEIKDLSTGLRVLAVKDELLEVLAVLNGKGESMNREPLRLQYLKDSKKKMGLALWNVLSPKVDGYNYGPDSGVPTFSLDTLKEKGLIKWF